MAAWFSLAVTSSPFAITKFHCAFRLRPGETTGPVIIYSDLLKHLPIDTQPILQLQLNAETGASIRDMKLSSYCSIRSGRSEWKFPLCGRITYRHFRRPKLPNFLYLSNRLFGGGAADAGNAVPTFCFSVPAISKLTTLTVESKWTAPTETAKHLILAIDETS